MLRWPSLLFGHVFLFLLCRYWGMKYTRFMVHLCLTFKKLLNCFQGSLQFYLPISKVLVCFSNPISTICVICLFILAIIMGMKWYLSMILILISLMPNDIKYIYMFMDIYLSSLMTVYVNLLPIFLLFFFISLPSM